MTPWGFIALAALVTVAMAAVDFAHARYVMALTSNSATRAAAWSVAAWLSASVGFVAVVRASLWLLPFEGLGLFLGTLLGARLRFRDSAAPRR